jgi:hypothetical protein
VGPVEESPIYRLLLHVDIQLRFVLARTVYLQEPIGVNIGLTAVNFRGAPAVPFPLHIVYSGSLIAIGLIEIPSLNWTVYIDLLKLPGFSELFVHLENVDLVMATSRHVTILMDVRCFQFTPCIVFS